MKYLILILLLSLSSCVSKEDYNNLEFEKEQLENKILELESNISTKNNRIKELETSLNEAISNSNNYYNSATTNSNKGKEMLEQVSNFLYQMERTLSDYNNNSDINMVYKACKYWKSEIDSYLFYEY